MSRVLVLDDDSAVGRLITRIVGKEHTVVSMTSSQEALSQIEQGGRFDVIICDVNMPDVNGLRFFTEVARISREQARRIVFLTGGLAPKHQNRCMFKPPDPAEVVDIVGAFLPIRLVS